MKTSFPLNYRFHRLVRAGLDIIFPPVCAGCNVIGSHWCKKCQAQITPVPPPFCEICGLPEKISPVCKRCENPRPPYEHIRSWAVFKQPVRNALHQLKYKRNTGIGDALATAMLPSLMRQYWQFDMIVPIPLSEQRKAERGYNQVSYFAEPLAMMGGWQYRPLALSRTKHTQSQVGLSAIQRQENMKDAFRADEKLVRGKSILLMDDVITTGATVAEAARALKSAGAIKVYAFSVARALEHEDLQHI